MCRQLNLMRSLMLIACYSMSSGARWTADIYKSIGIGSWSLSQGAALRDSPTEHCCLVSRVVGGQSRIWIRNGGWRSVGEFDVDAPYYRTSLRCHLSTPTSSFAEIYVKFFEESYSRHVLFWFYTVSIILDVLILQMYFQYFHQY